LNGPQITVVGNVGGSPVLRSLADGTFVTSFSVAMTPSRFDKTREVWVDQETLWFRVTCWRALAEHASMSFNKGDKVIVTGTFSTSMWKDKDGADRTSCEIEATSVGMDLTRGPVTQRRFVQVTADPETGEVIPDQATSEQEPADQVAA
jgi:single-strand DNA-binding protein